MWTFSRPHELIFPYLETKFYLRDSPHVFCSLGMQIAWRYRRLNLPLVQDNPEGFIAFGALEKSYRQFNFLP